MVHILDHLAPVPAGYFVGPGAIYKSGICACTIRLSSFKVICFRMYYMLYKKILTSHTLYIKTAFSFFIPVGISNEVLPIIDTLDIELEVGSTIVVLLFQVSRHLYLLIIQKQIAFGFAMTDRKLWDK